MALPLKILELDFTVLEFHQRYALSKPREGQVLEKKEVAYLVELCNEFYLGQPFVYLSFRVNDYNVNPTVYINLDKVKNLLGIGIVSKKPSSLSMAKFEKKFSKLPYEIFTELNPAREWAKKMVEEEIKKADL